MSRAALLLSGGIDSISLLWLSKPALAYVIDYGQRPFPGERAAAEAAAEAAGVPIRFLTANVGQLGAGDMSEQAPLVQSSLSEWWPFRNQFLITVAAMAALADGVEVIQIGTVSTDDAHVDGSTAFIEKVDGLLAIQEGGLRLEAPAKQMTSEQLVQRSGVPLDILRFAHSCHTGRFPCGRCRGCFKHAKVWHVIESGGA